MGRCSLCSQEVRGGGSAWHDVLSGCRHDILTTHRARLMEPFQAAAAEVIGEMEDGTWDQGPSMRAAFMLDQGGGWAAPTGWVGHGGSLDGTRTNPWYGMFPQEWLDGVGEGGGDPEQAGSAWEAQTITAAGGLLPVAVCGHVEHGVLSLDSGGQACTHEG